MKNMFTDVGTLSLSIGEGYLSAYEVSILKPGDTVLTEKLAAEGFSVFFNGHFVFSGEVVILDHTFGIRVTSLLPPQGGIEVPGNSDDAVEMLPFQVRLGEIPVRLSDLVGVRAGTIINLDAPYSEEEDATLFVSGFAVARGKVGATYENMSLRITRVDGGPHQLDRLEVRSSGSLLERDFVTKFTKNYNFKRPDKFSRNAIDRMVQIHDLFVRNLRLKHQLFDDYRIEADQMTFGEMFEGIAGKELHFLLLKNMPWPRGGAQEEDAQALAGTAPPAVLVEPENPSRPVSDGSKEFIQKVASGEGRQMMTGVFVCLAADAPVSALAENDDMRAFLLASLRGAWKNIVSVNVQLSTQTDIPEDIKLMNDNEMVLTLSALSKQDEVLMLLVYPYLTLHPYVRILNL